MFSNTEDGSRSGFDPEHLQRLTDYSTHVGFAEARRVFDRYSAGHIHTMFASMGSEGGTIKPPTFRHYLALTLTGENADPDTTVHVTKFDRETKHVERMEIPSQEANLPAIDLTEILPEVDENLPFTLELSAPEAGYFVHEVPTSIVAAMEKVHPGIDFSKGFAVVDGSTAVMLTDLYQPPDEIGLNWVHYKADQQTSVAGYCPVATLRYDDTQGKQIDIKIPIFTASMYNSIDDDPINSFFFQSREARTTFAEPARFVISDRLAEVTGGQFEVRGLARTKTDFAKED